MYSSSTPPSDAFALYLLFIIAESRFCQICTTQCHGQTGTEKKTCTRIRGSNSAKLFRGDYLKRRNWLGIIRSLAMGALQEGYKLFVRTHLQLIKDFGATRTLYAYLNSPSQLNLTHQRTKILGNIISVIISFSFQYSFDSNNNKKFRSRKKLETESKVDLKFAIICKIL